MLCNFRGGGVVLFSELQPLKAKEIKMFSSPLSSGYCAALLLCVCSTESPLFSVSSFLHCLLFRCASIGPVKPKPCSCRNTICSASCYQTKSAISLGTFLKIIIHMQTASRVHAMHTDIPQHLRPHATFPRRTRFFRKERESEDGAAHGDAHTGTEGLMQTWICTRWLTSV